jgi:SAM-dependent methyltransferase
MWAEFCRILRGLRILEIGFSDEGRLIGGSKVLDLYDSRIEEIDYRYDARSVPLPDASFDAIVCCSVLEHIPDFWRAASEIQRLLEPSGLLWCEVPTVWPYHPLSAKGEAFGGDDWRATHEGLTAIFEQCEPLACWYDSADPQRGDNQRSGFMATYIGQKK